MTDEMGVESQSGDETQNGARRAGAAMLGATQDAADKVRTTAERARARLPDAVASAQGAANETQRRLDEMPNQALLVGTTFSIGMGVGMFLSGANRLLVAAAILPAVAMATTIFNRQQGTPSGSTRRSNS